PRHQPGRTRREGPRAARFSGSRCWYERSEALSLRYERESRVWSRNVEAAEAGGDGARSLDDATVLDRLRADKERVGEDEVVVAKQRLLVSVNLLGRPPRESQRARLALEEREEFHLIARVELKHTIKYPRVPAAALGDLLAVPDVEVVD